MSGELLVELLAIATSVGAAWESLRGRLDRLERRAARIEGMLVGSASAPGLLGRVMPDETPAPALPAGRDAAGGAACDDPPRVLDSGRAPRR